MLVIPWTSLVAQTVKRLSTMWETWVRSLGWEYSLEKEMATHSSTLALKIPWTEELGAGYYPWGRKESGTTEQLHFTLTFCNTLEGSITSCCIEWLTHTSRLPDFRPMYLNGECIRIRNMLINIAVLFQHWSFSE